MRLLLACLGFFCLTTTPLLAHHLPPGMEDVDEFDDDAAFMSGVRHALLSADHWLAALAVGAVVAMGATRAAKAASAACFLAGIVGGAAMGVQGIVVNASLGLLVAGMLVVMHWPNASARLSALKLAAIAMLAFWQGNQHGIAWPLDAGGGWYLAGMLCMTAGLVGCGAGIAWLALGIARPPHPASVTTH